MHMHAYRNNIQNSRHFNLLYGLFLSLSLSILLSLPLPLSFTLLLSVALFRFPPLLLDSQTLVVIFKLSAETCVRVSCDDFTCYLYAQQIE